MNRPNWKKSILYQGILQRFKERGRPLTGKERRILRDQLVAVAADIRARRPLMRTLKVCHKNTLGNAFTWSDTSQGDDYWRGISYARIRPRVIR